MVSVEAPESLLLEVAGSLKLFGSLEAIKAKLREELARRYRDFRFCVGADGHRRFVVGACGERRRLAMAAAGRQLGCAAADGDALAARGAGVTQDLGLRTIGDCVRLPRDGFARRVGRSYLLELDRAFGRSVDLRAEFKAPQSLELDCRARARKASTAQSSSRRSSSSSTSSAAELDRRQAQIGEPRARFRASASAAYGRTLRFARADARARSIAASHRGSIGAQRRCRFRPWLCG